MTFTIGGFNNYARRGICETCCKNVKTKVCKGKCKEEKDIEEFAVIKYGTARNAKCKACVTKARRADTNKKPKKKGRTGRQLSKTDGNLANNLTMMKW